MELQTTIKSIYIRTQPNCSDFLPRNTCMNISLKYLTIIPLALLGSDSIAREIEGFMGYLLRSLEGKRNNCFR